jgi:hypothetical protein
LACMYHAYSFYLIWKSIYKDNSYYDIFKWFIMITTRVKWWNWIRIWIAVKFILDLEINSVLTQYTAQV